MNLEIDKNLWNQSQHYPESEQMTSVKIPIVSITVTDLLRSYTLECFICISKMYVFWYIFHWYVGFAF